MHHHPVLAANDGEPAALADGGQAVARPLQVMLGRVRAVYALMMGAGCWDWRVDWVDSEPMDDCPVWGGTDHPAGHSGGGLLLPLGAGEPRPHHGQGPFHYFN